MTRPRASTRRVRGLSEAEMIELRIGPALDQPSLFGADRERTEAAELLAELDAGRDQTMLLLEAGSVLAELRRRHAQHWQPGGDDPDQPALFLTTACGRCNPLRWDLPRDESAASPLAGDKRI